MKRAFRVALLIIVASAACKKDSTRSTSAPIPVAPVAEVTVVGCVEPADRTAVNSAGENDTRYMLTHAQSKGSNSPVGTVGSSSALSPPAGTYRLNGNEAALTPEVGHQVEVVAIVEDPAVPSPATGATASDAAPKLKVETIKMVAVPCPD